ncbi:MAG: carboxypeptidase-like regulatory domain-containing protein, partial [Bacteroidales bacterium]|nr:carboxypeptidase-like regulatory domain-containing protein [Bacteroidales bacterium]
MLLVSGALAFAQNQVSGTVKDANGEPIIAASVVVRGTTIGVVTDLDGNYTLSVP